MSNNASNLIVFDDDDDLFSDDFVSKRRGAAQPGALPKPLAELTEEEAEALGAKHKNIVNRKKSTRRRLEGTASNKLRTYLHKHYKAVTTRVNSGEWVDSAGNTIRGAESGTSDILACVPIRINTMVFGIYFAFEVKSIANRSDGTDDQKAFIARVIATGGYGAVVRTSLDVDAVIEAKRQAMIAELKDFINNNFINRTSADRKA